MDEVSARDDLEFIRTLRSEEHRRSRVAVALGQLLDDESLGIQVLSPGEREAIRDVRVASTPVIELRDPRRYLVGEELLLITGFGLPARRAEIASYVARLLDVGVAALGFGLLPVHAEVPEGLVEECRAQGLPLIAFPDETPFIRVTMAFAALLESERVSRQAATIQAVVGMTRTVLGGAPVREVLERLAQGARGGAQRRRGREVISAGTMPTWVEERDLRAVVDRGPSRQRLAFSTVEATAPDGRRAEIARLRLRGSGQPAAPADHLLLVREGRLGRDDLTLLMVAGDLLDLRAAAPTLRSSALNRLTMTLLADADLRPQEASAGPEAHRRKIPQLLHEALGLAPGDGLRAVLAEPLEQQAPSGAEGGQLGDHRRWRQLLASPLVDGEGASIRALVSEPPSAELLEVCAQEGWVLGVSTPRPPSEVASALADAGRMLGLARQRGRSLLAEELDGRRPGVSTWEGVVPAEARAAFSARLLAPLEALGPERSAECRRTLRCWLAHHGGWDATARELRVHRNSVRRMIATAGRVLELDLDDAGVRVDLLLALDWARAAHGA